MRDQKESSQLSLREADLEGVTAGSLRDAIRIRLAPKPLAVRVIEFCKTSQDPIAVAAVKALWDIKQNPGKVTSKTLSAFVFREVGFSVTFQRFNYIRQLEEHFPDAVVSAITEMLVTQVEPISLSGDSPHEREECPYQLDDNKQNFRPLPSHAKAIYAHANQEPWQP